MARRRYISTKISQDTAVNQLARDYGDFAVLLYTWMIPHAADDATITSHPEELLMMVVPGRRDKEVEDVVRAVDGMLRLRLIFKVPDKPLLQFPVEPFYQYQAYIADGKRSPALYLQEQEPLAEISGNQRQSAEMSASVSISVSPSISPSEKDATSEDVATYDLRNQDAAGLHERPIDDGLTLADRMASPSYRRPRPPAEEEEAHLKLIALAASHVENGVLTIEQIPSEVREETRQLLAARAEAKALTAEPSAPVPKPTPDDQRLLERIQELRGAKILNWGTERKHAKTLLREYSLDEIVGTWQRMNRDPFWGKNAGPTIGQMVSNGGGAFKDERAQRKKLEQDRMAAEIVGQVQGLR